MKPDITRLFKCTTDKVGVAVMTYNNPVLLDQCLKSLAASRDSIHYLIVVNDGTPYNNFEYDKYITVDKVITLPSNKGVGIAKNLAMRELLQAECEHVFLLENDMTILRPDVFSEYIRTAKTSGIFHLNFGLHQRYNKNEDGTPNPRLVIKYDKSTGVALYRHILGALTYFHKDIIFLTGYHDERYFNAMEHVDHTFRVLKQGYHTPFWFFADIYNSGEYIQEYPGTGDGHSSISGSNFKKACEWFKHKHEAYPTDVQDTPESAVISQVKQLQLSYGSKRQ